jgi:hypothetical protein
MNKRPCTFKLLTSSLDTLLFFSSSFTSGFEDLVEEVSVIDRVLFAFVKLVGSEKLLEEEEKKGISIGYMGFN